MYFFVFLYHETFLYLVTYIYMFMASCNTGCLHDLGMKVTDKRNNFTFGIHL